ncbi:MAG TPA: alpha/beta hydrolase-fold protein [Gammaproteobacteria bacterium]|jgi:hypothetical protein
MNAVTGTRTGNLALAIVACSFALPAIAATKPDNSFGRHASKLTLSSKEGRHYRVQVSVPDAPPPKAGYPVLYVLDGNGWFGPAADVARMREYEKLSPTIVVGIAPPNKAFFDVSRSYDFTPPGTSDPDFEGIPLGGADKFLAFLDGVVKPWVASHYKIDPHQRFLFGHSMGGLFALHALFKSPGSFDVYLVASASIPYGNEAILKEAPAFESDPRRTQPRVLITVGSLEGAKPSQALMDDYRRWYTEHPEARGGESVDQVMAETFPPGEDSYDKIGKTRDLAGQLAKSGAQVQFLEFDGDEHMAAGISALNSGIPFALRPPGPVAAPN